MTLTVDVEKTAGSFPLAVAFTSDGQVTALFGKSGAGKTTLVNLIAGLLRADRGRIALDDTVLVDTAAGINVPAHRRGVGYVFQEGRLFPHLSVRGNLLYGQRFAHDRKPAGTLEEVTALLGIRDLLDRRPADLSGGEKQRVAIGRALLASPRLLLMDEPLASLDQERKNEILPYIERLRDELRLPIVYVSHAVDEVARLADTLVVLAAGRSVAVGGVNEVFSRLDLGRLAGKFEAGTVLHAPIIEQDPAAGITLLGHPAGRLSVSYRAGAIGTSVRLRVRARDVALAQGEPGLLSIRNRLTATVAEIAAADAHGVDVKLDVGGEALVARITRSALAALGLEIGRPVVALIKSTAFDRPESDES